MPQHFLWRLLLSAYWFLGEPASSSANSVPGNKDKSEDLEVAVPQIPRFQEGEISRSQDLWSTSSNIVTVDGAPIYSVIQGASHTQTQLYCEHLSEMPEIDCWVYFGPEDKNIKLNITSRGGNWLQSQIVYGDYSLIIAINSSFSVNNRTRSAAECHL